MTLRKRSIAAESGIAFRRAGALARAAARSGCRSASPAAQERVLGEIAADMAAPHPMHRLLQGDVGSGKTIVALLAALGASRPAIRRRSWRRPRSSPSSTHATVGVVARAARHRARAARPAAEGRGAPRARGARLGRGARSLVGTHALIQEGVRFARLGLGIIDEQHRFGVRQRAALQGPARTSRHAGDDRDADPAHARADALRRPRPLVARRAAARPPADRSRGSSASETAQRGLRARARSELDRGRQAYVVFPLVEEQRGERRCAARPGDGAASSPRAPFAGYRVGLLHGG